jgi:hypothetical protein
LALNNPFETITLPYFGAEFDYFRLEREKWELYLTRLAQMGLQGLSLRIPWGFHEVERGRVDLTGATNPRRDLSELVDLCHHLNFHCLLNFGPDQHADLVNQGLPGWLNREDGETALAEAIEGWYRSLSQHLSTRQWPNGPIILVQINDRAAGVSAGADQQLTKVRWPIWLRKRYHGIEALNEAYGENYHSVSEVEFPQNWAGEETPLARDAKRFLAEVQQDSQEHYLQLLVEAGWQIPIQMPNLTEPGAIPAIHSISLNDQRNIEPFDAGQSLVLLRRPIQVDRDPADIGLGLVWAYGAPIRADGSLRRSFWQIRAEVWRRDSNEVSLLDHTISRSFEAGGLISAAQDSALKLDLNKGSKPTIYRLDMRGEVKPDQHLSVARGKLSGTYLAEAEGVQTDFVFFLDDPALPLPGFLATYLLALLKSQVETLAGCAALAATLVQTLRPNREEVPPEPASRPGPTSYTLAEARRGLQEADVILRKAMASVGGLETGLGTILGRREPDTPQPAAAVAISPEIFEGAAREILLDVGQVCKALGPQLEEAAAALRKLTEDPVSFRLEQYQQGYQIAVTTAERCLESLSSLIGRLRSEIVSETLPLLMWRVHDQLLSLAGRLRWGVKREN